MATKVYRGMHGTGIRAIGAPVTYRGGIFGGPMLPRGRQGMFRKHFQITEEDFDDGGDLRYQRETHMPIMGIMAKPPAGMRRFPTPVSNVVTGLGCAGAGLCTSCANQDVCPASLPVSAEAVDPVVARLERNERNNWVRFAVLVGLALLATR